MVTLKANQVRKTLSVRAWKGLNEEDATRVPTLDMAKAMSNVEITPAGELRRRGGLKTMLSLIAKYIPYVTSVTTKITNLTVGDKSQAITLYPRVTCNDNAMLGVQGTPVSHIPGYQSEIGWYAIMSGNYYRLDSDTPSGAHTDLAFTKIGVMQATAPTHPEVQAIWSGYVAGEECICAVAAERFWSLSRAEDGSWSKADGGAVSVGDRCSLFPFGGNLYILTGKAYYVWDGTHMSEVEGYAPIVLTECSPGNGSGNELQSINLLSKKRRCRYSPDGTTKKFYILEMGLASIDSCVDLTTGEEISGWTPLIPTDTAASVTFSTAPAKGIDTVEITYTVTADESGTIKAMTCAELFNGSTDSRVFLYGDGTNTAYYSGIDFDGTPRADYFSGLTAVPVGDSNTPLRGLQRHYDKLLAFKDGGTWSISYGSITSATGTTIAGFYVTPIHREYGSTATGQVATVNNAPRTFDSGQLIEWKSVSTYASLNGDARNAHIVSGPIRDSLAAATGQPVLFYDGLHSEFYAIFPEITFVQNTDNEAWFCYALADIQCVAIYKNEVYFGTGSGTLLHFSHDYATDDGATIESYVQTGDCDFSAGSTLKNIRRIFVGMLPADDSSVTFTLTAKGVDAAVTADSTAVNGMQRLALKSKKFETAALRISSTDDFCINALDVDLTFTTRAPGMEK